MHAAALLCVLFLFISPPTGGCNIGVHKHYTFCSDEFFSAVYSLDTGFKAFSSLCSHPISFNNPFFLQSQVNDTPNGGCSIKS
ncbi:hypothetical protein CPB84DRAFT_315661 [Gymnopilus junonius]|uniref:Secreted protein n=1 Tax=Gymnopilus junonius TaxID=109634 RepID=A0A9P5NCH7_GYMJU|nr:hypothetical protein CPB84DRAFT_315661 [Gymnopilus junonius]